MTNLTDDQAHTAEKDAGADATDVRAGIERLIVHWRDQVGDDMDMESKTLRQVCNVLESILKYAAPDERGQADA